MKKTKKVKICIRVSVSEINDIRAYREKTKMCTTEMANDLIKDYIDIRVRSIMQFN